MHFRWKTPGTFLAFQRPSSYNHVKRCIGGGIITTIHAGIFVLETLG